jgi:hypothetical protein
VVVNAGESALEFYKVYNRSDKPIAGIAIYQIFPEESALYFNKIQCFCFENQLLYPQESVDLPLLFFLDPAICHDANLKDVKDIILTYHFYPSADQSVARVLQAEIEKHQQEEKELAKRRQKLIDAGVELKEVAGAAHGVPMPGFNPKDSAETYVSKIMANQKRMENTIKRYEEDQLKRKKEKKLEEENIKNPPK